MIELIDKMIRDMTKLINEMLKELIHKMIPKR